MMHRCPKHSTWRSCRHKPQEARNVDQNSGSEAAMTVSRRSPAGAREATASELGSAVVNQFRIWLARHCRLSFRLASSSEITRIPEARSKGSPRGSVFFALLTRSKTSFTDLNRVNRRPSVCRGMRRHLAIGAARGWSRRSLELQPDDPLKNKIG
jgi:hypothetical protein